MQLGSILVSLGLLGLNVLDRVEPAPAAGPNAAPIVHAGGDTARPRKKAEEALTAASKVRREANGKTAEEKMSILTRAAAAYERVGQDFADDSAAVAEANFRAGEIWRTLEHAEDAHRCFDAAARHTDIPGFAARALNELGHLERRLKQWEAAAKNYAKVLEITPEQRAECVRALTWQAKILLEQNKDSEGHALLLAVGPRYPDFPLDDIRNVDRVATDWIQDGKVAQARELVADCVQRHSETADTEEGDEAEAIAKALDKMKARKLLAGASGIK